MKYFFCCICLLGFWVLGAQEKLGISNSNYSSSNSIYLNPSSSVDSRAYMQMNLAGVNAFVMNNIVYQPKFSFWSLLNPSALASPTLSTIRFKKFVYSNGGIDGPAFVISKRNYGAGLFVRARFAADVRNIPNELINLFLNNFDFSEYAEQRELDLRNVKASSLAWTEYGLNGGYMIKKQRRDLMTLGANLKYLTGINFFYANIATMKGFYNDTLLSVENVSAKLRYNQPAFNSGKGFGLDAGFTFKRMLKNVDSYYANSKQSNCTYIDYQFKLAVSLRDVGYIKFKNNPVRADLSASGTVRSDTGLVLSENTLINNFQALLTNGNTRASIPANISVQADYNFGNHFYLNATLVKNIVPVRWVGVQSPNLISICPRYEFRNFELAMPLTFHRFLYPQLGFAFRVRSFVLGFDNAFPLFVKKKTYGLGVYFNLGISLYRNPACRGRAPSIADCPTNVLTKSTVKRKKKSGSRKPVWRTKKKKR